MSVWVCNACGKWWRGKETDVFTNPGADESCMLNAARCAENANTEGKDYGCAMDGWTALPKDGV